MKNKRRIILGVLAVLIVAYIIPGIPNYQRMSERKKTVAALQGLSRERLDTAVQAFARERKAGGGIVPATVSLHELVSAGYLHTNDIRGLENRDAIVSLSADMTNPLMIRIRVHWDDRLDIVLVADGSVLLLRR